MSDTVPITFQAVDSMSASLATIMEGLTKLTALVEKSTDSVKDMSKEVTDSADTLGTLDKAMAIARNGVELAKMGFEAGKIAYEALSAQIGASLAAWDELAKKTGKSASGLGSVGDAATAAAKAQKGLYEELGRTIERSGVLQVAYGAQEDLLKSAAKLLKDNEKEAALLLRTVGVGLVDALKSANTFLVENADTLAMAATATRALGGLLTIMATSIKVQLHVAFIALNATLLLVTSALLALSQVVNAVLGQFIELPQALQDVETGLGGIVQTATDNITTSSGAIKDSVVASFGVAMGAAGDLWDAVADGPKYTQAKRMFDDLGLTLTGVLDKARATLTGPKIDAPAASAKLSPEQLAQGAKEKILALDLKILKAQAEHDQLLVIELEHAKAIAQGEEATLGMTSAREKALTRAITARTAELEMAEKVKALDDTASVAALAMTRRILEAQAAKNTLQQIELEREQALIALGVTLAGIQGTALRDATRETEELRIQMEYRGKQETLQAQQRADRKAAAEEQTALESELRAAEDEQEAKRDERLASRRAQAEKDMELARANIDAMGASFEAAFADGPALFSEQMDAAFKRGTQGAAMMATNIAKFSASNKGLADSQDEVSGAISGTVSVAGSLVAAFSDNVKTRAKWEAAFNAAAAIAATALSFVNPAYIPVAVGHAAAAVKFGLVAGGVIGGGGTASAGGGGGGTIASAATTVDLDRERRLTAESIAESIATTGRGGGTVINIDFGSSLIASTSPQAAQELVDLIAPELSRRIG